MRRHHVLPIPAPVLAFALAFTLALALTLALAFTPVPISLPAAFAAHDGGHGGGHGTTASPATGAPAASAAVYSAKGTITGLDKAAGTITLRHEAVPAVRWPAMTMTFRLEDPSAAGGLKQGDAVRFDFRNDGPTPTVVHIEPLE
ncbi:MAG: copper-binding protein [Desulfovibrio sp.]|jgi:Cu(I)/Ag(I) efflux system membrane fusion protein|nr:copper-binding protein [Desulfovibrio sp.]